MKIRRPRSPSKAERMLRRRARQRETRTVQRFHPRKGRVNTPKKAYGRRNGGGRRRAGLR